MKPNLLKIRRWEKGIKQYELAEKLKCSAPYLSMVENSRLDPPLEFKLKVIKVLKATLQEVFPADHKEASGKVVPALSPLAETIKSEGRGTKV